MDAAHRFLDLMKQRQSVFTSVQAAPKPIEPMAAGPPNSQQEHQGKQDSLFRIQSLHTGDKALQRLRQDAARDHDLDQLKTAA